MRAIEALFSRCRAAADTWLEGRFGAIFFAYVIALLVFCALPVRSFAQLPQLQAPPSWGKVPQGSGACSVEKSCADLAPGMIRDALGASPLEQNIRALERMLSDSRDGSPAGVQAEAWTEEALRKAGADEVRVERIGLGDSIGIVEAEIRGREFPRDYVLIAAPLVQSGVARIGAAENVAVPIDAVRVIHASGNVPRRSIRFVFFPAGQTSDGKFAAEWAYVRQHRADIDRIAAVVAIDAASGPLDGYSLGCRPGMLGGVRQALEPLGPLGIRSFSEGVQVDAATTPFWLEGVPTLVATAAGGGAAAGDSRRGGAAQGSLDATELEQLKRAVAVAAVTAYALADSEVRIGVRRSPAEVQHSIESLGIEAQLKAAGLWDQWQSLQRQENH